MEYFVYVTRLTFVTCTVDSRYLEHRAISNKTLGPFSTNSSGVTTHYLELPAISNFLPGPLRVRDSAGVDCIRFVAKLNTSCQPITV